jgi:hypothetical protein
MFIRKCFICGKEIFECMGSVHSGTFLLALKGNIPFSQIKEFCPKCASYYTNREDEYPQPESIKL